MSKKPPVSLPQVAPALADVALVDASAIAAAASISRTQWWALVGAGKAPQPAFRRPRCTRWRVTDVRAWLASLQTEAAQ